jgi:hypothetical protein
VESYAALRSLYGRIGELDKARACDDALIALGQAALDTSKQGTRGIESLFEPSNSHDAITIAPRRETPQKPLAPDDWNVLARVDVDPQLSVLFAIVAPPFAVERARMRPPIAVPVKEPEVPASIKRALDRAIRLLATPRPPVYVEADQIAPVKMVMRARGGVLTPVLVVGKIPDRTPELELVFRIARQLADLRTDRIARLLCPRAGELAQIIELASSPEDPSKHAERWLTTSLHPVELEQARSIGAKLRERAVHPAGSGAMTAALGWLAATERAADRIAFAITGDLAGCVKILQKDQSGEASRVGDLVWSSITEDVLGVRGRLEEWPKARRSS